MIKKNEIIEAIHEGVFEAHEDFELLSGGDWISDQGINNIEGFLASKIFLAVNRRVEDSENLVFELPFGYIKRWTVPKQEAGRVRIWQKVVALTLLFSTKRENLSISLR